MVSHIKPIVIPIKPIMYIIIIPVKPILLNYIDISTIIPW